MFICVFIQESSSGGRQSRLVKSSSPRLNEWAGGLFIHQQHKGAALVWAGGLNK